MKRSQQGIAHPALISILVLVLAVGAVGYYVVSKNKKTDISQSSALDSSQTASNKSSCPDPLLQMPADITKVTAVLYPGQTRGGNYKAHGGLRFDGATNAVEVKAPIAGKLIDGSRYIEQGETQVLLDFKNDCGVNYRLDHLLTLSPKVKSLVDTLPAAKVDDSQTTQFNSPTSFDVGEVIATAVGFTKTNNVSFDFGVYDMRSANAASKDASYQAKYKSDPGWELDSHALCWLDYVPSGDSTKLKALPGGDQASGKTSDYCK